jgi:CheY-like chemotaxis protein/HPt (histidine-containing phosphotransfer) domain-containing protein
VVRVQAESRAKNEIHLHFAVSDTGIGVPPEKQHLIFGAFEQADNSMTRRYGGTGLGLAISSQLVVMLGGRIWLESREGRGSTFHFTARFGVRAERRPGRLPAETAKLRNLRVLVVDDNATSRRILEETVKSWQMETVTAGGGAQALEAMEEAARSGQPFALALIDSRMPDMDGFALARRIKASSQLAETRVIILTQAGSPAIGLADPDLAATLTKPVKHSALLAALVAAVGVDGRARPVHTGRRRAARHLRILLAEDDAVNQRLAVRLMEKAGHTVEVASSGREVLDLLANSTFDLVLMDVQMPDMDGLQATAEIRRREKSTGGHVPIIALTAYAMQGDRDRCLEAGMDGYVAKPIRAVELMRAVDNASIAETPRPDVIDDVIDERGLLTGLNGDRRLLAELIGLFQSDAPRMLEAVNAAVKAGDPAALQVAAHKLKGSVANFSSHGAFQAALRMENLARSHDMAAAPAAYAALENEVGRLRRALNNLEEKPA